MTEDTKFKALAAAEEVFGWLREAKDAAIEQAPLLANEIVQWGIWHNVVDAVSSLLLMVALLYVARFTWVKAAEFF